MASSTKKQSMDKLSGTAFRLLQPYPLPDDVEQREPKNTTPISWAANPIRPTGGPRNGMETRGVTGRRQERGLLRRPRCPNTFRDGLATWSIHGVRLISIEKIKTHLCDYFLKKAHPRLVYRSEGRLGRPLEHDDELVAHHACLLRRSREGREDRRGCSVALFKRGVGLHQFPHGGVGQSKRVVGSRGRGGERGKSGSEGSHDAWFWWVAWWRGGRKWLERVVWK